MNADIWRSRLKSAPSVQDVTLSIIKAIPEEKRVLEERERLLPGSTLDSNLFGGIDSAGKCVDRSQQILSRASFGNETVSDMINFSQI